MLRAAHPSATWISTMDEPFSCASRCTCVSIASSYDEFSTGTSIRLYMGSASAEDLDQQPDVESGNYDRNQIGQQLKPTSIHELAHLHFVGRETHQRENRERKLHAENLLTQHQQLCRPAFAVHHGDDRRWNDRDSASNEPPQPGADADVEKSFHHDLAGECTGKSRILTRSEECKREHRARTRAEQRRQQLVRVLDLGHLTVARRVKRRRGDNQNRRVDEEREAESDRRIDEGEFHRLVLPFQCLLVLPRLYDRGVEVEVVRHHRGAEYADGDIEHGRVGHDLRSRKESGEDGTERWAGLDDLEEKTKSDRCDERDDQRLEQAESLVLEVEHQQHIAGGDRDSDGQRNVEEKVQRDGGPDHLCEVAGGNRQPESNSYRDRLARGRVRLRCRAWRRAPEGGSPSGSTSELR